MAYSPGRWLPQGWRRNVLSNLVTVIVVLFLNFGALSYSKGRPQTQPDTHELFIGSCKEAERINSILDILVNAFSTVLLSGSNTCLQILAAPTREQLDKAHRKQKWLHVGCFDFRNFAHHSWARICLVILLIASSIPIHLFYNSVTILNSYTTNYLTATVSDGFVAGADWSQESAHAVVYPSTNNGNVIGDNEYMQDILTGDYYASPYLEYLSSLQQLGQAGNLDSKSWQECVSIISPGLTASYRGIVVVADYQNSSSFPVRWVYSPDPHKYTSALWTNFPYASFWACPSGMFNVHGCDYNAVKKLSSWDYLVPINSCFSATSEECAAEVSAKSCLVHGEIDRCSVEFNVPLMTATIVCNAIKAFCFLTILLMRHGESLVTTADATASFLRNPDSSTVHFGAVGFDAFASNGSGLQVTSKKRSKSRFGWKLNTVSSTRWRLTVYICSGMWIAVCLILGILKIPMLHKDPFYKWDVFNNPKDGVTLLRPIGNLAWSALVVNLPQLLVSTAYVLFYNLFAAVQLAFESSRFASKAQLLRVSVPKGNSKAKMTVSLPSRYDIPLKVSATALHWFLSRSIFLVNVSIFSPFDLDFRGQSTVFLTPAWNPAAIVYALGVSGLLILVLFTLGFRSCPKGMPVMSTCSLAISANCHRAPDEGPDMVEQKFKYGVRDAWDPVQRQHVRFLGYSAKVDEVRLATDEAFEPAERPLLPVQASDPEIVALSNLKYVSTQYPALHEVDQGWTHYYGPP